MCFIYSDHQEEVSMEQLPSMLLSGSPIKCACRWVECNIWRKAYTCQLEFPSSCDEQDGFQLEVDWLDR